MGRNSKHVVLLKDKKVICRTWIPRLPDGIDIDKIPSRWSIDGYQRQRPSGDPQCFPLYPDAENGWQEKEWVLFLTYLQKKMLVAVVKEELFDFYLHPPTQGQEFTHAFVRCRVKKLQCKPENQESQLFEHGSPCISESISVPLVNGESHHPNHATNAAVTIQSELPRKYEGNDSQKNFIRTDPSYLVTLAQGHTAWIFGAIAELMDNSRDANATKLHISIDWLYSKREGKKIPVLSVIDNGSGMCHSDIVRMLSFGHKQPEKDDFYHIGRFGIGFKTGSMKLGRDALILTQTLNSRSVAFLSQSFNRNKDNLEIPIVSYFKNGHYMEVDSAIQSEEEANFHLKSIKDFSPFNEYFIGEKLGLFGENGSGTQIYIWNLDEWGSNFSLEWESGNLPADSSLQNHDILIRSRRIRSRLGQISREVPLDYSLRSYSEVLFLEPKMEIWIQESQVKTRALVKSLENVVVVEDVLMGAPIKLILGRNEVEWKRMNCGIFLYWHGRLIEAYKRVGGMIHNADMGRGIIGIVDVTDIMSDGNGRVWVLNNKQGFQDCEAYAKLEDWLGEKFDEYWDTNYDPLKPAIVKSSYNKEKDWVQCYKCHKWRMLMDDHDSSKLPKEWFCYMPPFNGRCEMAEQPTGDGVFTVAIKRSGCCTQSKVVPKDQTKFCDEENAQQNINKGNRVCMNLYKHDKCAILENEKLTKSECSFEAGVIAETPSKHQSGHRRPGFKRLRRGMNKKHK